MTLTSVGDVGEYVGRSYRLSPSPHQAARMTTWAHTRRAIHNLAIEHRQLAWSRARAQVTYREQCHELAELRSCVEWVAEPPAHLLQQALRDVDRAHQNWWQGRARKPAFERRGQLRFRPSASDLQIRHLNRKWSEVRLPKLGWVRFRRSRSLDGELASATFRCSVACGR